MVSQTHFAAEAPMHEPSTFAWDKKHNSTRVLYVAVHTPRLNSAARAFQDHFDAKPRMPATAAQATLVFTNHTSTRKKAPCFVHVRPLKPQLDATVPGKRSRKVVKVVTVWWWWWWCGEYLKRWWFELIWSGDDAKWWWCEAVMMRSCDNVMMFTSDNSELLFETSFDYNIHILSMHIHIHYVMICYV
jgi:hypothetical protein